MAMGQRLVPILRLDDPDAGMAQLCDRFGFVGDGRAVDGSAALRLGDQRLLVRAGDGGHGVVDHLALAVSDAGAALALAQARGARLEATTPQGVQHIPEFWAAGMSYVFVEGPEGARLEYCARPGVTRPAGHDHVGIPCADLGSMARFFLDQGATPQFATRLDRPDGHVSVSFLALAGMMLELYSSPARRAAGVDLPPGRLRLALEGATTAGVILGPEGIGIENIPL